MEKTVQFFKRLSQDQKNIFQQKSLGKSKSTAIIYNPFYDYQTTKISLPDNFAENLLNLELEMEGPYPDTVKINELLQLYVSAVEYYESIKNNRYIIFGNKIKNLMQKKNVIDSLNKYQKDLIEEKKQQKGLNINAPPEKTEFKVKRILEKEEENSNKVKSLIENGLSNQADSILKRLEERKSSKLNKCASQTYINSAQLPRTHLPSIKEKKSLEKESEDETTLNRIMIKQKENKRNSILMLRRASQELTTMIDSMNRRGSIKKTLNIESIPESETEGKIKIIPIENNLVEEKKCEITEINDKNQKNKKIDDLNFLEAQAIIEVEKKTEEDIAKLEQKKGHGGSTLISKMIEKAKKEADIKIDEIKKEFDSKRKLINE